jgi:hypothetical protein
MKSNITDTSQMSSEVAEMVGELTPGAATEATTSDEAPADTELASQEAIDKAVEDGILDASLAEEFAGKLTNQNLTDLGAEPALTNPDEVPAEFQPGVDEFINSDLTNQFLGRDGSAEATGDVATEAAGNTAMEGMDHAGHSEVGDHAGMDHDAKMDHSNGLIAEGKAPQSLIDGFGDWVDADGKVRSANVGGHANMHHDHVMGHEMNVNATYEAAQAAGIDAMGFVDQLRSSDANYNPGQSDEQKYVGAMVVLNDAIAAKTMGGLNKSDEAINKIAGDATNAALNHQGAELRNILTEAGGDVSNLSDNMLVNVWSTNSHMYNHAIVNVSTDHFALTHLRSLNDKAEDGTAPMTLGFYNDRGEWPQWDAHEDSRQFLSKMNIV